MTAFVGAKRAAITVLGLLVALTPMLASTPHNANAISTLADPAFTRVWNHCDKPVEDRMAARSWMWGPEVFYTTYEPYAQGPGGQHLVSYLDKSRMEINNPAGDRTSEWFVTNGLLVVDMISGQIQVGDNQFLKASPANIPVAGDTAASINAPTYAALVKVASLAYDKRAPNRIGQSIREGLGRIGNVGIVGNLSGLAKYAVYDPTLGHNIAGVFWSYMNQKGVTYHNGSFVDGDLVVDWLFAMGYPITEPYWIQISVGGHDRWVLMQAFQRRILTYSPDNPTGWQVEMGNVGRAYYEWRYNQPAPVLSPTPKPAVPSITLNPTSGNTSTRITVTGKSFPAGAAVTLGVEKAEANYSRGLGTVTSKADGTFSAAVTLPSDAARFGDVTITATANSGAVRATATFQLSYSPTVTVFPHEIVPNASVRVQGEGFPASTGVKLGALFNYVDMQWLANTKTDSQGNFDVRMAISSKGVGTTFKVVALADGGFKATSPETVRVIPLPYLKAVKESGPVGANVELQGKNWPPNIALNLGMRSLDNTVQEWLNWLPITDGAGNFSATVYVGPEYARFSEIRLIAYDPSRDLRVETPYYIIAGPTPTPTARPATVSVSPSVLTIGMTATVTGTNWPAGWVVFIGVGRPGYGVEEWLTTARADGNRNIVASMVLGSRWHNAGELVVTASIPNGKLATTIITVVDTPGRIKPMGLPMTVESYTRLGSTSYKVEGQGWRAGSVVHISVVSADGAVNAEMLTVIVGEGGAFQAGFYANASWAARTDLGVRATTLDGLQYSLRYLPLTSMTKVSGTGNTYNIRAYNWPANTKFEVFLCIEGQKDEVIGAATSDANGAFSLNVNVPRIPGTNKNDIEIRAEGQPYAANFDF